VGAGAAAHAVPGASREYRLGGVYSIRCDELARMQRGAGGGQPGPGDRGGEPGVSEPADTGTDDVPSGAGDRMTYPKWLDQVVRTGCMMNGVTPSRQNVRQILERAVQRLGFEGDELSEEQSHHVVGILDQVIG